VREQLDRDAGRGVTFVIGRGEQLRVKRGELVSFIRRRTQRQRRQHRVDERAESSARRANHAKAGVFDRDLIGLAWRLLRKLRRRGDADRRTMPRACTAARCSRQRS
jgi:hypothetical protein